MLNSIEIRRLHASLAILLFVSLFALFIKHRAEPAPQLGVLALELEGAEELRTAGALRLEVHRLLLGDRMRISEASERDLMIVPGIGQVMSKKIIDWRFSRRAKGIRNLIELEEIRGIGAAKRQKLEVYLQADQY